MRKRQSKKAKILSFILITQSLQPLFIICFFIKNNNSMQLILDNSFELKCCHLNLMVLVKLFSLYIFLNSILIILF